MQTSSRAHSNLGGMRLGGVNLELVLALLLLGFTAWYGSCRLGSERTQVADDAYVAFSYARNLAEGHGFRFNASDASPTPGCSTELNVLYSAVAIRLGFDPLVASRALALFSVLAIGVMLGLVAAALMRARWSAGLLAGAAAAWGLMLMPETSLHLSSGMETLLFALVHAATLAWASWTAARVRGPDLLATSIGAVLLAALVLVRPEGWILALLYAAALIGARVPRAGLPRALRECAGVTLVAIAAVVVMFAWRHATFGHLLGNPYFVKSQNAIFGSDGAWLPGLADVARFALLRLLPAILVVGLAASAMAFEARVWVPATCLLAPSLIVLALYTRAIHEMAGGFRYEYPLIVPWIGAGVGALLALSLRSRTAYRALLASVVFVVPALAAPVRPPLWDYLQHARSNALAWCDRRVPDNALSRAGRDLELTQLGSRATILLSAAGQIPWYSRFTALDWIGLQDTKLSGREALGIDEVWSYIDSRNPDVVQSILPPAAALDGKRESDANFCSEFVQATLSGRGSELFQHWDPKRFAEMVYREMRWVRERCVFGACYKLGDRWGDEWWVFLYVRKDSAHRDALLGVLRESKRADTDTDLTRLFAFDPRLLTQ